MATKQEIREFLRREYKHERFEGRDGAVWGGDYSEHIVEGYVTDLAAYGNGFISRHESVRGQPVKFDAELNILSVG